MKTNILSTIILLTLQGCLLSISQQSYGMLFQDGDPVKIDTLDYELMNPAEGIQFFKNGIIILSNSKLQQKMISDHISFGQTGTYLIESGDLSSYRNKMFIAGNPFPVNPEGMSFTSDFEILYYTASDDGTRGSKKIYMVPIERSRTLNQASFDKSDVETMPFCTGNDDYLHPAVSSDNSFIVFASDNSGSSGGFDLFVSKKSNNKWGEPVNLGSSINSSKDEMYPFLDRDNNLYFSSEGHSGFGGFDIYMCKFINDGWGSPVNLMKSINGPDDDVAISIDAVNRTGYFSAINRSGENKKQLFKISLDKGKLSDALLMQAQDDYKVLFDEDLADANEEKVSTISLAAEEEKQDVPVESTPDKTVTTTAVAAGTTAAVTAAVVSEEKKEEPVQAVVEEKPVEEPPVETPPEPVVEEEEEEVVIFRVQITSSSKPKTNYKVTIDGKSYSTFQYHYVGAYRYCVGEFRSVSEANAFKNRCRAAGFNQAFVAAFINDQRETDPSVFKR